MCSPRGPPRLPPASPSACRNFYERTRPSEISKNIFSYVKIIYNRITHERKKVRFKYICQNPGQSNVEFSQTLQGVSQQLPQCDCQNNSTERGVGGGGSRRQSHNIYSSLHHFARVVKCLTDGVTHGTELSASRPPTEPGTHQCY